MRQILELASRAYAYACPPPFGILNPIHRIALRAQPLTLDLVMWFNWLVLPLIPLVLMSYILVGGPKDKLARESRPIRAALAVAGWTMMTHSFLTRRFTSEFQSAKAVNQSVPLGCVQQLYRHLLLDCQPSLH